MNFTIIANDEISAKNQLRQIYKKVDAKPDLMNTMTFDCLSGDINSIIEYCISVPFFAENKFAIVKNPLFLTSKRTNIDFEEYIDKFSEYLNDSNESTILIFYLVVEDSEKVDDILDKRKKIVKLIRDKTRVLEIERPDFNALRTIILKKFNKLNNTIDDDAINYIITCVGNNLSDIKNEIDKISLFKANSHISKNDIINFVSTNDNSNIFDLCNLILKKDVARSLALLNQLLKEGMEPIVLIFNLAEQFRIALLTKKYLKKGYNQKEISSKLKIHPYRVKLASELSYQNRILRTKILDLAQLDYDIKAGKVNNIHGIKLFILKA
ncbi:MAG: DNA polymerase III subunit delta [Bacilli bacterium]|jgi:DNA polymerase-3 subunit delta|nr:DNA polymerase III subunit delta [Bacilli bacterium]